MVEASVAGQSSQQRLSSRSSFAALVLVFVLASCAHAAVTNLLWSLDLDLPAEPFSNASAAAVGCGAALLAALACFLMLQRAVRRRWVDTLLGGFGVLLLVGGGVNNLVQVFPEATLETPIVGAILTVTQAAAFLLWLVVPSLVVTAVAAYAQPAGVKPTLVRVLRNLSLVLLWVSVSLAQLLSFGMFYSDGLGIGGVLLIMLLAPLWPVLGVFTLVLVVLRVSGSSWPFGGSS